MEANLDGLRRELEEATRGMSEAEWDRAPQGSWSSAQIMEHLGRTYSGTAKMLQATVASGQPPQLRPRTLRERFFQFLVLGMGQFPSGRKAPEFISPQNGDSGPETLRKALAGLEKMKEACTAAEGKWGRRIPIGVHFALGPMNIGQWKKLHCMHGHHHVRQMKQRMGRTAG